MIENNENLSKIIEIYEKSSLVMYGYPGESEERLGVIEDGIKLLQTNPDYFRTHYLGTKDYAGWKDQRSDHKLYYGPQHGSIVFSVEIKSDGLGNSKTDGDIDVESSIKYLLLCRNNPYIDIHELCNKYTGALKELNECVKSLNKVKLDLSI